MTAATVFREKEMRAIVPELLSLRFCLLLAISYSLVCPTDVRAQLWETPPLPPVKYAAATDGMAFSVGTEQIHISVCRGNVVHFVASAAQSKEIRHDQPWMLDQKESCPGAKFHISQNADDVILTTDALKIEFSLKWGIIQYNTLAGEALLRERSSLPRTYEPVELNDEDTFHVEDRFAPDFSEGFYGLGQHQNGLFNYRGATVELGQNNTDVAIPLLLSSKGYALMWNTASLTYVDNRFPLELNLRSLAGRSVDYYFIYGPEMDALIHEYRSLTGHAPLLPAWAYGFFQSKDRYISQEEILGIAQRYRKEHIPLDAIVQDWSGGKRKAIPYSIPISPTFLAN
jgi:alpha-D-xyloside xylohydrolase